MASCSHEMPDGGACRATPRRGRPWCFVHDPELAEKRAEARSQGGKARQKSLDAGNPLEDLPDVRLESEQDVLALAGDTITHLRKGWVSPEVARAIGALCTVALKAKDQSQLDTRLKALEEQFRPLKGRTPEELIELMRMARGAQHGAAADN